jgi:hypothetical protein
MNYFGHGRIWSNTFGISFQPCGCRAIRYAFNLIMRLGRFFPAPMALAVSILLWASRALAVGTWTQVAHPAPGQVSLMLLLSDGTVMAANSVTSSNWYRLTPDIHGSYVNGTWSTLAAMRDTRLYYSSEILTDGRVFVAGGEDGTGTARAEVYDPLSNIWRPAPVPLSLLNPNNSSPEVGAKQGFYDSESKILPDGSVLVPPVGAMNVGGTLIYYPASNTWSNGPIFFRDGYPDQDEASWVKLPDNSILTIDPVGTNSERFIPALNEWINDANVPIPIYSTVGGEIGPALLLADGRAFFLGGSGHTAFYTPSGNTNPGTWAAGPDIPGGLTTPDAAAAMMVNGKVLCAVGPALFTDSGGTVQYTGPTSFYEFDPVANSFTATGTPSGSTENYAPFETCMLDLPDGTVLYSRFSTTLRVYQPDATPLSAGKPVIRTITESNDGSYLLTGTLLNGISEGAAYGDDAQMNSDYPLIRLTNSAGNVYYARTYNWSSTGVMTGTNLVTTQFTLPAALPAAGTYSLIVVANGISSDPVSLTPPLALQFTPSAGNRQILFSWPSLPSNAGLETAATLSSGTWTSVSNGVTLIGNRFFLITTNSATSAFFRLYLH